MAQLLYFFFENCIFIWTLKFVSAWLVELYIITDKKHIDRWRSGEDMATQTRPRWCLSLSWAVDWTCILYQKNWLVKKFFAQHLQIIVKLPLPKFNVWDPIWKSCLPKWSGNWIRISSTWMFLFLKLAKVSIIFAWTLSEP